MSSQVKSNPTVTTGSLGSAWGLHIYKRKSASKRRCEEVWWTSILFRVWTLCFKTIRSLNSEYLVIAFCFYSHITQHPNIGISVVFTKQGGPYARGCIMGSVVSLTPDQQGTKRLLPIRCFDFSASVFRTSLSFSQVLYLCKGATPNCWTIPERCQN